MNKFNIGDVVRDCGQRARIIETPITRGGGWGDCYLTQFENPAYGHDGLGFARVEGIGYHWTEESHLKLIERAKPLSELEQSLVVYIAEQFKELGLS